MGMLIDGHWEVFDHRTADGGRFLRADSSIRGQVTADGSSGFAAEAGRYHLYVSLACPWAHRTVILRLLKGLEQAIGLTVVAPVIGDYGWQFNEPDPLTGASHLYELYQRADPGFSGRVTVPVLWDKVHDSIVNNESSEIIRMLNREFDAFARHPQRDYYPKALRAEIDTINERVYRDLNNGVYRTGFAQTQEAYEEAVTSLFDTLDWLEQRLARSRFLVGNQTTEADWRLFPTLVRFDAVYHYHFKCNLRRLVDYPNLHAYARELYQHPGVAQTVDLDQIKANYYRSMRTLNPFGIVPLGPEAAVLDFGAPHGRDRLQTRS